MMAEYEYESANGYIYHKGNKFGGDKAVEKLNALQAENARFNTVFKPIMEAMEQELETDDIEVLPRYLEGLGFKKGGEVHESFVEPLQKHLQAHQGKSKPGIWLSVPLANEIDNLKDENARLREALQEVVKVTYSEGLSGLEMFQRLNGILHRADVIAPAQPTTDENAPEQMRYVAEAAYGILGKFHIRDTLNNDIIKNGDYLFVSVEQAEMHAEELNNDITE